MKSTVESTVICRNCGKIFKGEKCQDVEPILKVLKK